MIVWPEAKLTLQQGALLGACAPLLWWQGRQVRRQVPRLPAPAGPYYGECGQGPLLRLLIVGDSSAAGVGASVQDEALAGVLVGALASRWRVRWRLCAQVGASSADALSWLRAWQGEGCDVAVTALGVNDVTGQVPLAAFVGHQREIITRFQALGARQVLVSRLPPLGRFPALPQPLRAYLGVAARRYDQALLRLCETEPACEAVSVALSAAENLMASDGFHPGPGFYARWGRALAARVGAALVCTGAVRLRA